MKPFIFKQDNKSNWPTIQANCYNSIKDICNSPVNDYIVEIGEYSAKKSSQQLRSYWMLINSVKCFMQNEGNSFFQEEISNWFKIKADHYIEIEGEKVLRSISNKSDTNMKEMMDIIKLILKFGIDNDIKDCHIEDRQLEELLNNYKR